MFSYAAVELVCALITDFNGFLSKTHIRFLPFFLCMFSGWEFVSDRSQSEAGRSTCTLSTWIPWRSSEPG